MMTEDVGNRVESVRRLLDEELDRNVKPYSGCWPLLVAVVGVLLGLVLLVAVL